MVVVVFCVVGVVGRGVVVGLLVDVVSSWDDWPYDPSDVVGLSVVVGFGVVEGRKVVVCLLVVFSSPDD